MGAPFLAGLARSGAFCLRPPRLMRRTTAARLCGRARLSRGAKRLALHQRGGL